MNIVEEVITKYGGVKAVMSRYCYKSPHAVYQWRMRQRLPKSKLLTIHMDTGIPMSKLIEHAG